MPTYSSGLIKIAGDAYFDTSGSTTANINTANMTVNGTLSANVVNTTNLNFGNNLTVGGNFAVAGNTTGTGIATSLKTALTTIVDKYSYNEDIFGPANYTDSSSHRFLYKGLDTSNYAFTPGISVCVLKDNDIWEYGNGIINAFDASFNSHDDAIHSWLCVTKTIITLLYARLKTIGVIPPGSAYPISNLFPQFDDSILNFWIPTQLDTSANPILTGPNGCQIEGLTYTKVIANPLYNGVTTKYKQFIGFTKAKTMFLEDILSENVGFYGGFTWNGTQSTTPLSAINPTYWAACKAAYDTSFNEGSATSQYYSTVINQTGNFAVNVDSVTAVNNWLNQYSTQKTLTDASSVPVVVMWADNGVFNYNISQNIGCAALLKAYRNYYPAWDASGYDFYDLINQELLSKVDSNLFWFFDSSGDDKFNKMSTIFTAYSGANGTPANANGYQPVSTTYDATQNAALRTYDLSSNDITRYNNLMKVNSYDMTDPSGLRLQRYKISTYDNPAMRPRNYYGNGMVFGTNLDYMKVIALIARNGLDASGNRLISVGEISNLKYSRYTQSGSVAYNGTNYFIDSNSTFITSTLLSSFSRSFALGGYTRGPGFTTPQAISAFGTLKLTSNGSTPATSQGTMTVASGQTYTDMNVPMETFGWLCTAGGSWPLINTNNNAAIIINTDDQIPPMSAMFVYQQIVDTWSNYLTKPGSDVTAIEQNSYYSKQVSNT